MNLGKYKEEKVYQATKAFKFADLQTFVTILIMLNRHDLLLEDLVHYVDMHRKHAETPYKVLPTTQSITSTEGRPCFKKVKPEKSRSCGDCDTPMAGYSINTRPCNQVEGGYDIQWICPKCDREDFE